MNLKLWIGAAALSAVVAAGTSVQAGLFDRLRDSPTEKTERKNSDDVSFAVADARDIGKIVSPVSYQPLPAPGADPALVPVPEPYPAGPSPAPVRSYYPAELYPVQGLPVPGYPVEGFGPGHPIGQGMPMGPGMGVDGFPLYSRVEYEDRDHIHPCAVPTVVQVLDPCSDTGRRGLFGHHRAVADCDACGPKCVYVEICVPPGCPKVKVTKDGRKVKYDYGDYQVEVESKDGYVAVDYDD